MKLNQLLVKDFMRLLTRVLKLTSERTRSLGSNARRLNKRSLRSVKDMLNRLSKLKRPQLQDRGLNKRSLLGIELNRNWLQDKELSRKLMQGRDLSKRQSLVRNLSKKLLQDKKLSKTL